MHFNPTEEQAMYRETIARFLDDRYSVAHRQQFLEQRRGYDPENWSALADLGVLSLPIPDGLGGLGGTAAEIAIIQEELGYRLAVEPFRSEEHTSELQSLMRISYAVFCLKKKIDPQNLSLNSRDYC